MLNYKNKKQTANRGLTLIETLAALSIFTIAMGAVFTFIFQGLKAQNTNLQQIIAQTNTRYALKKIVTELRGTQYSEEGNYPIGIAENNSLTFYSDIDSDAQTEKIRYFLDGNELKRGETQPEGKPPKYFAASEKITTITKNVAMGGAPIFKYYDGNFTGTESPMSLPINLGKIRLIHITVIIDANPNQPPEPLQIESEAVLRNLKDNL